MTTPFMPPRRSNFRRIFEKDLNGRKVYWTLERIKNGVEQFIKQNNRFPSASDFNLTTTLPTSRHINMYFGSMNDLRKLLSIKDGYDPHRGVHRSQMMKSINLHSLDAEQKVYKFLRDQFGEMYVHSEKKFILDKDDNPYQNTVRVDFFVYNKTENFAVDVFCCQDMFSFANHAKLKIKKYKYLNEKIFLVPINNSINNENIVLAKKGALNISTPAHVKIVTEEEFRLLVGTYLPYFIPEAT